MTEVFVKFQNEDLDLESFGKKKKKKKRGDGQEDSNKADDDNKENGKFILNCFFLNKVFAKKNTIKSKPINNI